MISNATSRDRSNVHSHHSLNIINSSGGVQRPAPKPRKSKDGPVIMKRVNVSHSLRTSRTSAEKLNDSHTDENLGQLYNKNPGSKTHNNVATGNVSGSSEENMNESLGLLRKSASDSSLSSQKRVVTKHVSPRQNQVKVAKSVEFEDFASHGLVVDSPELHTPKQPKAAPRQKNLTKVVSLLGSKAESSMNPHSEEFAKQGLLLKQSLGSESDSLMSEGKKPTKEVSVTRDGKKQINYSSDFEEYSLSTLLSLGDNMVSNKGKDHSQKTKVVQLHSDGKKHVSYTKDVEEFTSQTLEDLNQGSGATGKVKNKPRRVTSSINTSDGERSMLYTSDFDSHSLASLRSQSDVNESDFNTVTRSRDKEVTSWVEFKEGKRQVRVSDEFENFSLGQAIQFISKPKKGKQSSHKQVDYRDGKKSVTYSDDFQSSLQTKYSDDFDSFSESWAMKVKRNSLDSSPVTKRVEYKQGKKHVTYSAELENTLERTVDEMETATSFREIALQDIEDESYTEDFDSTTARVPTTARSIASVSVTEEIDQLSSSTLTAHTSIQTSIHQYGDQYSTHSKDRALHSESFASVTSIPRSESAEVGDDTSPRYRTDTFSRTGSLIESETEDESYTMTFSHPTVESVEESPEIKRQTQEAEDSFVAQKLKLLRTNTSEKSGDISRPSKKEKLEGAEAKQLKKFVRDKLKILENKPTDTSKPESLNVASCQLQGINLNEPVEHGGISQSAIIRLNMENTLSNMKHALEEEMHDPRVCQHCSDEMSSLAAEQFMWHKKAIVSEKLVKEKMEMQMLQLQDPMWLYAEALRGLPHPTDHREDVYDRLMRPLYDSYAKNNTTPNAQPTSCVGT